MPYIRINTNAPVTPEDSENIKAEMGKAIGIISGKSEKWLMVSVNGWNDMSFAGSAEKCAIADVQMYGGGKRDECEKLCAKITEILTGELDIPADRIYVKFEMAENWGWNGGLF